MTWNTTAEVIGFKKFILRTCCFLTLLFFIRILIGYLIPYHTGGGPISAKIQHIEQKKLSVDIMFMGTSRVKNSIIPAFFDSLTNRNRKPSNISYNLAMHATRIGENLYLLKHFSNSEQGKHLKVVFIEWTDTYFPHPDNRKTERARYWMDAAICRDYLLNVKESHGLVGAWKEGHISYIISSFLHRSLSLAHLGQAWIKPTIPDKELDQNQGVKLLYGHAQPRPKGPINERVSYFDSSWIRQKQAQTRELRLQEDINAMDQDVKQWNFWLAKMKRQGIHMVLLIMPGLTTNRQLTLARNLPAENILDLSDPDRYDELYNPSVYYDRMHFNDIGARLLTRHLAEGWNRISQ